MQDLANRVAKRFDQRHPILSGLVGSLVFASIGLASALFGAHLIRTEVSGPLVAAMIVGTAVGVGGAAVWAYAFAHEFVAPIWVGRLLFVLTVAAFLGPLGAVSGMPLLQGAGVALMASRFLPQALFALLQAREDVRHPEKRAEWVRRAITMASWSRPK